MIAFQNQDMLSLLTEKLGSTDKVHAGREQFTYIYLIIIDGLVVKTKHTQAHFLILTSFPQRLRLAIYIKGGKREPRKVYK